MLNRLFHERTVFKTLRLRKKNVSPRRLLSAGLFRSDSKIERI